MNPSGGTLPYNYVWSANTGGQTSAAASNLGSGIYNVTITDANGCSINSVGMVNSASSTLAVSIDTVIQGGCSSTSSGSIEINCIWWDNTIQFFMEQW